jgi:dinuclear metal center YbgI/SA1388 family protein
MARASAIAEHLDRLLRTKEIPDYPGAVNGLQLSSPADIERVATAVDFSSVTVREAARSHANMLIVHHGMFWGAPQPLIGPSYERLAALIDHRIAVYSSHLPLDLHPDLGNNVLLARELGLQPTGGFARFQSVDIGVSGQADVPTQALVERARTFATQWGGNAIATPFESDRRTRFWGVCTGAGADSNTIREATERGIDTLVVGEGPHHTAVQARDLGMVIVYAGHYATETLGVRALGEQLAARFGVKAAFLDAPTGL